MERVLNLVLALSVVAGGTGIYYLHHHGVTDSDMSAFTGTWWLVWSVLWLTITGITEKVKRLRGEIVGPLASRPFIVAGGIFVTLLLLSVACKTCIELLH